MYLVKSKLRGHVFFMDDKEVQTFTNQRKIDNYEIVKLGKKEVKKIYQEFDISSISPILYGFGGFEILLHPKEEVELHEYREMHIGDMNYNLASIQNVMDVVKFSSSDEKFILLTLPILSRIINELSRNEHELSSEFVMGFCITLDDFNAEWIGGVMRLIGNLYGCS